MLARVLRSRPVQLAIVVGLGVYVFLAVVGLLLRHSDQWVQSTEPKRSDQKARDLTQWYHKQEQIGQGEKLDEILQMLKRIRPDGQENLVQDGANNDISNSVPQTGGNRTYMSVLANSAKRQKVDLSKVLEQPNGKPPPVKKVPLESIEYMHEPHYRQSVSMVLFLLSSPFF